MINEAIYCLMEGVGDREAIDTVMKLGMNHPMGPLTLADLIGLDACLAIMEVLHEGFGDAKYRPCPLLRRWSRPAGWAASRAAASTSTDRRSVDAMSDRDPDCDRRHAQQHRQHRQAHRPQVLRAVQIVSEPGTQASRRS